MSTVLFDLDGTLTDSRPGIVNGLRRTLRALGHEVDGADDLTWAIGPATEDVFRRLLAPHGDGRIAEAVRIYRGFYDESGWRENAPYEGIAPMLAAFRAAGLTLYLATSKRVDFARRIMAHFYFSQHFAGIYGAEMDGTLAHKAELIAYVVRRHGIAAAESVMIGDRSYDISGAHANRMRAIGVTWGYGARHELEQAGAEALADRPEELLALAARQL